jgi:hypothetical protein
MKISCIINYAKQKGGLMFRKIISVTVLSGFFAINSFANLNWHTKQQTEVFKGQQDSKATSYCALNPLASGCIQEAGAAGGELAGTSTFGTVSTTTVNTSLMVSGTLK